MSIVEALPELASIVEALPELAKFNINKKFQTDVMFNGVPHRFIEQEGGNINLDNRSGIMFPLNINIDAVTIKSEPV